MMWVYHRPGGFQPGKMKKYQRDHEDPAHDDIDIDTEKQFTAQVVSSLER